MIDLSLISNLANTATGLSNIILVNPQNDVGVTAQTSPPKKFLFDYQGEQTVTLAAEITDHYVEDNTALQDQIALKPTMITTHGFIGELNDIAPDFLGFNPQIISDKLIALAPYSPGLSISAELAYNQAFQAYQAALAAKTAAVSAYNTVAGTAQKDLIQNKQQTAFQQFASWMSKRVLFTVQTPWAVFQNMAILTLRSVQDAETQSMTDFEITFKKMSFVVTNPTAKNNGNTRYTMQDSGLVTIGDNTPQESVASSALVSTYYSGDDISPIL